MSIKGLWQVCWNFFEIWIILFFYKKKFCGINLECSFACLGIPELLECFKFEDEAMLWVKSNNAQSCIICFYLALNNCCKMMHPLEIILFFSLVSCFKRSLIFFGISFQQEASIDIKLPRRSLCVQFTCDACGERSERLINRLAFERGTVFVQVFVLVTVL